MFAECGSETARFKGLITLAIRFCAAGTVSLSLSHRAVNIHRHREAGKKGDGVSGQDSEKVKWELRSKRGRERDLDNATCVIILVLCVCVWGHLRINPVTCNILINYQWWNIAQQAWALCVWERKCVQWPWEKGAYSRLLDTLKTAIDFNGENLEPFQPLHPIKHHFTHTFRHTHTYCTCSSSNPAGFK